MVQAIQLNCQKYFKKWNFPFFLQGTNILFLKLLLYLFKKSHSKLLDLRFFVFI